jgi:hypothetical protein
MIRPEWSRNAPPAGALSLRASLRASLLFKSGVYFKMIFIRRIAMSATPRAVNGVRFRTKKGLFFKRFAFKFGAGVTTTRALTTKNNIGACGLV